MGCHLCKNGFLYESTTITSYEVQTVFTMTSHVNCNSTHVIYIITDKICSKSYVGYTITSARDRWSTHKSHIKRFHKSCTLSSHFINTQETLHKLNRKDNKIFNKQLASQLAFQIIEKVSIQEGSNTEQVRNLMGER